VKNLPHTLSESVDAFTGKVVFSEEAATAVCALII
jgi:hypothetical protein